MTGSTKQPGADAGKEFDAHGSNAVRVENEYKITVPEDITEDVWQYLLKRYDNRDLFLKEYSPGFTVTFSDEDFTDVYFDTDELELLKMESAVRHRTRRVTSDEQNRKHGRELVQIKLKRPGDLSVNRTEIKFPVTHKVEGKQFYGLHPVIGLIEKGKRQKFIERVKEVGIDPVQLKETLTLDQRRRRAYVSLDGKPFATITLDQVSSKKSWHTVSFTEVEMELNEIAYTVGSQEERDWMQAVNDAIKTDLFTRFPEMRQDQRPKYNKVFDKFSEKFLFFPWALRNEIPAELVIGALAIVGVAGCGAAFVRRKARKGRLIPMA